MEVHRPAQRQVSRPFLSCSSSRPHALGSAADASSRRAGTSSSRPTRSPERRRDLSAAHRRRQTRRRPLLSSLFDILLYPLPHSHPFTFLVRPSPSYPSHLEAGLMPPFAPFVVAPVACSSSPPLLPSSLSHDLSSPFFPPPLPAPLFGVATRERREVRAASSMRCAPRRGRRASAVRFRPFLSRSLSLWLRCASLLVRKVTLLDVAPLGPG